MSRRSWANAVQSVMGGNLNIEGVAAFLLGRSNIPITSNHVVTDSEACDWMIFTGTLMSDASITLPATDNWLFAATNT